MKKILYILTLSFMFVGCTQLSRGNTNIVTPTLNSKLSISSFIDLELVCKVDKPFGDEDDLSYGGRDICIYVDKNTDVLYVRESAFYRASITPIMKADGTCLTYSEWKKDFKDAD